MSGILRRLRAGCMTILAAALATMTLQAAPPRNQVPGYFRYAAGDFVITALQDGVIDLGLGTFPELPPQQTKALLSRAFALKADNFQTSVNAYLVDTGSHRILVDTGNANCYGWKLGGLTGNLRASGYYPADVDIILLTHLHGDHVCGLAEDGKRVFPNATVWAAEEELRYWQDNETAPFVRAVLTLYGRDFRTFRSGDTIAPGLRIVPSHGHTPGHTAYLFEPRGASFLVWGDIVHAAAVQFARPDTPVISDADRKEAVATRSALFAQLAKDGTLIAGAHLPFPGIGHIRKEAEGYIWVPVEFGPLPK